MTIKYCICSIVLMLVVSTDASAQQHANGSAQLRGGEKKIRIGVSLIAAGALLIPATRAVSGRPFGGGGTAGLGLMMGGGCMVVWGLKDQQKAVRPRLRSE